MPAVLERIRSVEKMPLPSNLAELIDAAAKAAPDRDVWNFFETGERETYDGLRRRVNYLAAQLQKHGVTKGRHVGVMLPNIPAMPLTWLALAKVGAVMVPVNTAYKERELAYVLLNSEAEFLIIHDDYLPRLEGAREHHGVAIPQEMTYVFGGSSAYTRWEELADGRLESFEPAAKVQPNDLLNIQYTSGTTGFPKGCMLTQQYWLVSGHSNAHRDGRRYENLLASTPFFYMDPQWLLLMTIIQRGTLFVAQRQSTSRFMTWVREHKINFCLLPWILYKEPQQPDDDRNSIVRANIYGVPRAIHAEIEQRFGLKAREAFGMTELGPTLFMPIEASDMVGSGSCGLPAPFRECRLVDEYGNEVDVGEPGELLVRGKGMLLGYYRNPEATAESMPDGWFRTGDLFRKDHNGFYTIIGRRKDMVRRSGENIAAREVEAVLNAFPYVSESAIIGVPDERRGEEVKAYIVVKQGVEETDGLLVEIVRHCEEQLAAFKVPRFYEFRKEFPRTGSAKIAKHLLRSEDKDLRSGAFDRVTGSWG
nr:class I adenylate-forming enzyme family protein [Mesorhizobium sp. IRAMC:0171]